ncbi:MAG: flagellar basal body P-ring formation protein FlgA [Sterolibacteriaceae bacterium]|nr:flagellar basal body P-ring formation protein FlgA [Candidatus Methylophosphatis haderslevensis]
MNEIETIVRKGAWRVGLLLTLGSLLFALVSHGAQARQDPAAVKQAVEDYLRVQTRGLPGEASFTVTPFDPNNNLLPCTMLEAFTPPGARLFGRTHVGVRCQAEANWQIYVPAQIRLVSDYLVAAKPLAMGEPVSSGDLARRRGDLGELPAGVLTREEAALGLTPRMTIGAGQPLRADMLKREAAVQSGQNVKVVSRGAGFAVSTDGQAMNNAADGQVARVRTSGGQTVSGIARAGGLVEISF